MKVCVIEQEQIKIFGVEGEINISSSPELKKVFEKETPKNLIVNLEKVNYIDSSGLATLVEMLKKTKVAGGKLILVQVSEKVKSLFEITKLDKLFPMASTLEDAKTKLG